MVYGDALQGYFSELRKGAQGIDEEYEEQSSPAVGRTTSRELAPERESLIRYGYTSPGQRQKAIASAVHPLERRARRFLFRQGGAGVKRCYRAARSRSPDEQQRVPTLSVDPRYWDLTIQHKTPRLLHRNEC
jgi:hypothetical protein